MYISSIQVGKPKTVSPDWTTAIFKKSVTGPVYLGKHNLQGDQQADLKVHGGIDKAVNVYPIEHYQYWNQRARFPFRRRIALSPIPNGAFGENFTTLGFTENEVCIGDTFKIGTTIVQVSQPRQPCWKLARKFNQPKLPIWVKKTGKTGWYFRVLLEGNVTAGDAIKLLDRNCSKWTIEKTNQLMHLPQKHSQDIHDILECPYLSSSWRKSFEQLIK